MSSFKIVNELNGLGNALAIQGIPIGSGAPDDEQVIIYDEDSRQWRFQTNTPKVDRSGDTMTGDLFLSIASDMTRQLVCETLSPGQSFRILFGDTANRIRYFQGGAGINSFADGLLTLRTLDGPSTVELDIGRLSIFGELSLSNGGVMRGIDPPTVFPQEIAPKIYVDDRPDGTVSVRAAHLNTLNEDAYEWSFGDDEDQFNVQNIGWVAFRDGIITNMGLSGCEYDGALITVDVTIALVINGVEQAASVTKGAAEFGATIEFVTPLSFSAGDRITFRSKTTVAGNQSFVASFLAVFT